MYKTCAHLHLLKQLQCERWIFGILSKPEGITTEADLVGCCMELMCDYILGFAKHAH